MNRLARQTSRQNTRQWNLRKASDVRIITTKTPDKIRDFLVQQVLIKSMRGPKTFEITEYQNWQDRCILLLTYNLIDNCCVGILGVTHDDYSLTEIASSAAKGPDVRENKERLHLTAIK